MERIKIDLFRFQLTEIKEDITKITYTPLNAKFILTGSKGIYQYDIYSQSLSVLKQDAGTVRFLCLDEIAENVYWIDNVGNLNVMSIARRSQLALLTNLKNICRMLIPSVSTDKR